MKIKQKRIFIIFLGALLLLLLIIQLSKSKEIIDQNQLLQFKIRKQQQQNHILKSEYLKSYKSNNSDKSVQAIKLKECTAEILLKAKKSNLKLIDFSSAQNELNLNITGDFHSILNFVQFLEGKMIGLQIEELKIKKNNNELFFFLKLKNELI